MSYLTMTLVGFGILLLFMNFVAGSQDSPEAQKRTNYIALILIVIGVAGEIFVPKDGSTNQLRGQQNETGPS